MIKSTLSDIDLTIRSWFASDEQPNLRIRDAYLYWSEYERIENPLHTKTFMVLNIFNNHDVNTVSIKMLDEINDWMIDNCFVKVFDKHFYENNFDLAPLGWGDVCDCCGVVLNPLNASPYVLCDRCNYELTLEREGPVDDKLI